MGMKLRFAVLGDNAYQDRRGRIAVTGIFDLVFSSVLPFEYRGAVCLTSIDIDPSDYGKTHLLQLEVIGPEAEVLLHVDTNLDLPGGAVIERFNYAIELHGIPLKAYGPHECQIRLNGELVWQWKFSFVANDPNSGDANANKA